ncbi:MAG TPA: 2,3-bisphosphoglycerate-independent phosphoglycerate mutase [Chthoniobacteraceae bacterium]|nr:2,3-bisphosphoglycerate-independent phosphoglycerate mutase [Chthoniobacteraceae bacterium]
MAKRPVVLIIRDGWGINPNGRASAEADGNATLLAQTPFHDALYARYPGATLSASGLDVGLPPGQMGNSEVGHLNLGAGQIVYQDLTRISKAIADGSFEKNEVLQKTWETARGKRLHLIGLVSDGGVHSHQDHLVALANAAHKGGVEEIMVHAITDGRDTSPTGGERYLAQVEEALRPSGARIATVIGRYSAMDRDHRWDRTRRAWDAVVLGLGEPTEGLPHEAVRAEYDKGVTDEFLPPLIFSHAREKRVRDGDVVLFFNFRADRARQLSAAFLFPDFDGFDRGPNPPRVHYVTLTEYDKTYRVPVVFPPARLEDLLGETVSKAGLKQLRIAETEKYPHVTYFFNGGIEEPFPGEDREIVPSPKVATYDLQPEMSAPELTKKVVALLPKYDLVILNFANPDMVGHTGVVEAGIKAVETIDRCVEQVVEATLKLGGALLVTADHGNCEQMRNADGSPNTAHTTNLVHFLYVADDAEGVQVDNGILADVAPTILGLLGLKQPAAMTGKNLLRRLHS